MAFGAGGIMRNPPIKKPRGPMGSRGMLQAGCLLVAVVVRLKWAFLIHPDVFGLVRPQTGQFRP